MTRPSRRDAVLSAAETVFADRGYDGATMRGIAEEAGVGLPLVTYHFSTKLNLYRAIFDEYQHLNEMRREALRDVDPSSPDALEQIVTALLLVAPLGERDARVANYLCLVLREASDPHASDRHIIQDLFDPMARDFIEVLERALPDKPEGFHRWAYLFAIGAYTSTNVGDRASALAASGSGPAHDRLASLHSFICAGIRHG